MYRSNTPNGQMSWYFEARFTFVLMVVIMDLIKPLTNKEAYITGCMNSNSSTTANLASRIR
jgi:hypothetical protein